LGLGYLAQRGEVYQLSSEVMQHLMTRLLDALPHDGKPAQSIANVLLGLGYLVQRGEVYQLSSEVMQHLMTRLLGALPHADKPTQDIANVLLGLGYLAHQGEVYQLSSEVMQDLMARLLDALLRDGKPTQEIANALLGLGYLAQRGEVYQLSLEVMHHLMTRLLDALPHDDKPTQHIANALLGLGYLAQRGEVYQLSSEVMHHLMTRLLDALSHADKPMQHITNALWAVGHLIPQLTGHVLDLQRPVQQLFNLLTERSGKKDLIGHDCFQVVQAYYHIQGIFRIDFSASYLTAFEAKVQSLWCPRANQIQQDFQKRLSEKGYQVQLEALICGYFVDLYFQLPSGQRVILEFDGEQHYSGVAKRLRHEDESRDALLKRNGYTVHRMSNERALGYLKNRESFDRFLTSLLQEVTKECSAGALTLAPSTFFTKKPQAAPERRVASSAWKIAGKGGK